MRHKISKILENFHFLTIGTKGKFSKIIFEIFSPGFHKKICFPVPFDPKIRFPRSKIKKIFKGKRQSALNLKIWQKWRTLAPFCAMIINANFFSLNGF